MRRMTRQTAPGGVPEYRYRGAAIVSARGTRYRTGWLVSVNGDTIPASDLKTARLIIDDTL